MSSYIVHSETGSGKTAAFSFPILNKLFKDPRGIFALVIVPTREVALQIAEQISFFGSNNNIRCASVIGGQDYIEQKRMIEEIPHIIVGTPGRMFEQISKSQLAQKYLKNMEYLVLDEADQLMNDTLNGFVRGILKFVPEEAQTIFSSATINPGDLSDLRSLRVNTDSKKELHTISLHRAVEKAKGITLRYCFMPDMVKDCYFIQLLKNYEGNDIIVFFNSCE